MSALSIVATSYLQAVASVRLSIDHVHEVVVLLLRLTVAASPIVPRTPALLRQDVLSHAREAHERHRVVERKTKSRWKWFARGHRTLPMAFGLYQNPLIV